MSFEIVEKSSVVKEIVVTVSGEAIRKVEDVLVEKARKSARLPGFRAGKVPAKLIRQKAGASLTEDARRECLQDAVQEALSTIDHLLHVGEVDVVTPKLEDGGFVCKVDAETEPAISCPNYKGLEVSRPSVEVKDEEVAEELEKKRERHAVLTPVEDRKVIQEGDVAFVTLSAPNEAASKFCVAGTRQITVGKGYFNADMEKALVGSEVGSTINLEAKVDDADAVVTCEINEIKVRVLPELDDAFALDTGEAETLDGLKDVIRKRLEESKTEAADSELVKRLLSKLREATPTDLPEGYIKARAVQAIRLQIEQMLRQQVDDRMLSRIANNIRPEELEEYRTDYHNELILNAIAKEEHIDVKEEDSINEAKKWFNNVDESKIRDWLKSGNAGRFVTEQVARDRALELVKGAAVITQE